MKTAVISDIHLEFNAKYNIENALEDYVKSERIGLLVIAGDIEADYVKTIAFVRRFEEKTGIMVRYVPGNHDLWNLDHPEENTDEIYQHYCEDERCLCGRDEILGNYVLIGDTGWYDYSYGAMKYSDADFDRMEKNGVIWQDRLYNSWTKNNKGQSRYFEERLRSRLEKYPDHKKILVTHMISHHQFKVPETWRDWDYFNAFLGSESLQHLCREFQVEYAICGHVHFRRSFEESGTNWLCRCLSYWYEWRDRTSAASQIRDAAEFIDL